MTVADAASWLRTRRGLLVLWLTATIAVAVTTVIMQWIGVPGWDDAAHAYKVLLLRRGYSLFWDNYWYGGGYGAIKYGFLFYLLAQYIPGAVITIVASGTVPLSYYLYQRDMWHVDDIWPACLLAIGMCLYQAHGQDPFLLALALTMAGLALLARRHPLWAALVVVLGVFANPMGFVVAVPFMAADVIARAEVRRRYALFALGVMPGVAARVALGWAFTEPGAYLNETSQLMVFLSFALVGLALAGVNATVERRPFVVMFLVYAVICVVSFVMPGSPLGNNIGRFLMVFCLPLLFLLRQSRLSGSYLIRDLAIIPVIVFACLQYGNALAHLYSEEERPQTTRAYFAPALRAASQYYDPNYRLHVVALRRHWEALYFPEAGYPITRGWYRQADAIHNRVFYTPYDGVSYRAWLRAMGVKYVFSARTLLDPWSRREARLLEASPAFSLVDETGAWRIYEYRDAQPLLVPMPGSTSSASGKVERVGHETIDVAVDGPGRFLLKFTWSPYLTLDGGPGRVRRAPGLFIELDLPRAGHYAVRFQVTARDAFALAAAKVGA